mmetsp:Transcript_24858/g.31664  ORF Transcript_24858/g.31664 Transcript_24858/m.31664 type:complete len:91 (-) Transcript_24858:24-296(-)
MEIQKRSNQIVDGPFVSSDNMVKHQNETKSTYSLPILLSDPCTGHEFYFSAFDVDEGNTYEANCDIEPPLVDEVDLYDDLDRFPTAFEQI